MYLTTHAAVGVLISQSVKSPFWAFVLSFISHFILDFVPHGDEDVGDWARKRPLNGFIIAGIDLGLITICLALLYATHNLPQTTLISAGVTGAILPDFLSNVFPEIHRYTSWLSVVRIIHRLQYKLGLIPIWRGHDWFHKFTHGKIRTKMTLKQGMVMQSLIVIIAMAVALGIR